MSVDRKSYILDQIEEKGNVRVRDLSQELSCSEVTIRNDIQTLESQGMLKRVHGGATRVKEQLALPVDPGNILKNETQKRGIAKKAFSYIDDQDTIVLDESSINYYLAEYIKEDMSKHIVVMTNSLIVALMLSGCDHVSLVMIGGQIGGSGNGKLPASMGELAVETIKKFHAEKAFISAHGINFEAGVTSIGSPQLQIKQAILSVVNEVTVMVDSSKFGGGYVMVVCPLNQVTRIITDRGVDSSYIERAEEKGVCMEVTD